MECFVYFLFKSPEFIIWGAVRHIGYCHMQIQPQRNAQLLRDTILVCDAISEISHSNVQPRIRNTHIYTRAVHPTQWVETPIWLIKLK